MKQVLVVIVLVAVCGVVVLGAQIYLPAAVPLSGTVLIAESFYETVGDEQVPLPIAVWQGANGGRDTSWFDTRIEAHPGDVIVIDPGQYKVDIWILTPRVTLTTDPSADGIADIWGTVEVDADGVILDHIAVTGPRKNMSSGHGIEVNRELLDTITIRNCLVEGNEWMGIHVIGPRGTISEMRIENCVVRDNKSFGIECQGTENLIVTGCTITGNKQGIHVGSNVHHTDFQNNTVTGNSEADIFYKD
jgi:parallel beta-helix repeat protein